MLSNLKFGLAKLPIKCESEVRIPSDNARMRESKGCFSHTPSEKFQEDTAHQASNPRKGKGKLSHREPAPGNSKEMRRGSHHTAVENEEWRGGGT